MKVGNRSRAYPASNGGISTDESPPSKKLLDELLGSNRQTRISVRPRIITRSWTH
jgi:hypothetical protein